MSKGEVNDQAYGERQEEQPSLECRVYHRLQLANTRLEVKTYRLLSAADSVRRQNSFFVDASTWHILEHCAIFKS
jgi:hypothetical protein